MLSTPTTIIVFIFMTLIISTVTAVHKENQKIKKIQAMLGQ
jgi:hypothetical protein